MKLLRTKIGESGNILLVSLVATAIVGLTLVAYLRLVGGQNQTVTRSQAWNASIPVIEAGMEEALTHLNKHGTTNILCDNWQRSGSGYLMQRAISEEAYYNVYIYNWTAGATNPPIIESRGFIRPPVTVASLTPPSGPMFAVMAVPTQPDTSLLARGVRATCKSDPLFSKGMVAIGNIDMNGANVTTDSFNSLTTNNVNGRFAPSVALHRGDVATDSQLVNVANATINGSVSTGPGGNVAVQNGTVTGSITDDMNTDFPEIGCPFSSGWNAPDVTTSTIIGGVTYAAIFQGGTGRNYVISPTSQYSLTGPAKVRIEGIVNILFRYGFRFSGSAGFALAPGAKLTIYAGGDVNISGSGFSNSGDPTQLVIYGLAGCTSMGCSGNGEFCGLIYAPYAALTLGGGGNSLFAFTGASVSKTSTLGGNTTFYYDEALQMRGPIRGYVLTTWNEMSPAEVRNIPVASN